MGFQGWFLMLTLGLGLISCFSDVQGFSCYICDSSMDGCQLSVSSKPEYLKECDPHPGLLGCVAFTVETLDFKNPMERWHQRTCLYNFEREKIDVVDVSLPCDKITDYFVLANRIADMNALRKENSISLIKEMPTTLIISKRDSKNKNWVRIQGCRSTVGHDGCNNWTGDGVFPFAEGYPVDQHISWIKNIGEVNCYGCNTAGRDDTVANTCTSTQSSGNEHRSSKTAYGCVSLSIYQITGDRNTPHFLRGPWYAGDSWCINKRFPSSPTGRSLVQYEYKKNGRSDEGSCKDGYARAFKARNSNLALEESYIWAGMREFQTKQEFVDFRECMDQVRGRLKTDDNRNDISFRRRGANKTDSGPFASIGFHFCGPSDYCNSWSEERIHEVMKTNPTQKPIATKPTTSTTTLKPEGNKTEGEIGGNCRMEKVNPNGSARLGSSTVFGGILCTLLVLVASAFHLGL